jgi:uncharacterized C2H2 Zn-finger protein
MTKETREGTDAIACDRCGMTYRAVSPHAFVGWGEFAGAMVGNPEPTVDVCPRCMMSMVEWWEDWRRQWAAKLKEYSGQIIRK